MTAWPRNPLAGVRGRVTFTVLAVTAVLYSLLAAIGFATIANSGRDSIRDRINVVLDDLQFAFERNPGSVELSTADGVRATVVDAQATVAPAAGELAVVRSVEVGGDEFLFVGRASEEALGDSLRRLFRALWIGIPIASVISALLAGLATRRALRPVGAITALAQTIGSSPGDARVPVASTGDEIEHLALTVNAMLERIERGRSTQRRFTSDAAHELRTPLMALRAEVELVQRHPDQFDELTIGRLDALCGRLGERIDDLVLLSTLDEERPLNIVAVALHDLAREAVAEAAPNATVDGEAVASVDRILVGRALRNVIANAQRHAAADVSVVLSVDAAADPPRVVIRVDDDGPGVPAAERAGLFDRFARRDEARTTDRGGAGLGLAIAASVVEAHHGGIAISDGPLGGASVELWFPITS